ncbi:MAG: sodium-dependent transporter [Candidatus Aminicenantes bacterium]|nr:sodium-dependent transporter [Candidatus Aminicenantes bacterium]MBL7082069.1 sodium-dependent transporter [Candidatus Aminicenantes bacterium]
MKEQDLGPKRETFTSFFGLLMTMIGVAVGLGAIWRFPYMVGKFGGAEFVLFYIIVVLFIGIPALMAEWTLGRYTKRGTLGSYEKGGFPGGKLVGAFLFFIVFWATGYYSNAVGWVGFFALGELFNAFGINLNAAAILPPQEGFNLTSFLLQLLMTAFVIFSCGIVLIKGLRKGIEKISKWIVPSLFSILIILIFRSVTLRGASEGIKWYIGGFRFSELTPSVMAAAMGMAFFSMSLGGTFMVIYGSYLNKQANIPKNAILTGIGASTAGILAGFAIFPAVFSFGLDPGSDPALIFSILPKTFVMMPAGWLFGLLFFLGLFGAAYLSDVAAFEVLVGGVVDNSKAKRKKAVLFICCIVYLLAIPPMINFRIFVPWDLIFGSGMQALGSLLAVLTSVWCIKRAEALKELSEGRTKPFPLFLYWWMRIVVPIAIIFVGINWLLEYVFKINIFG